MTVGELKETLKGLDDNIDVIIQKDREGNDYSPCDGADSNTVYVADTTWSGEAYSLNNTAEENGFDTETWERLKNETPVLVLFPVN